VSGYFAAALSLFITQPINNFAVYKQTNLPYKLLDIFNYRSFGIRLVEQTIQVGTKMYIMDHLNSNIKLPKDLNLKCETSAITPPVPTRPGLPREPPSVTKYFI
jgi:hypothetical protein